MNITKIIKKIFHPMTIKIVTVIFIVWFFFILPTFAQWTETTSNSLASVQEFLNKILQLCSRWWIILAILAGKLMTNDWVYGAILHMDIYLWKIRNIMKNFANFALVAIIMGTIISNLVGKKDMNIKELITKTLLAGILIQASRFLVAALVDVSTIAVSAVGSFPSSFLRTDAKLQTQINHSLTTTPKRFLIDIGSDGTMKAIDTGAVTSNWEEILPTYNSVSGPLMYLWFSVFKFQNYMNNEWSNWAATLTISFLLRVILIVFYTIWLALLFIANIIRVVFLRVFIIGAPFMILLSIFKSKLWWDSGGWITKYLNFEVMIDMIFKPVIFVAWFSLILILVVSIQSIMQWTIPQNFNGVEIGINSWSSTLTIDGVSSIEVKENAVFGKDPLSDTWETVKDISQTIFVNLIIFFLTIFLVRQFIKMSVTSGKWPIKDIMSPMVDWIEKAAKSAPVLPLQWWMSFNAMRQFSSWQKTKLARGFHMDTSGRFDEAEQKFEQYISWKMWIAQAWTSLDYTMLQEVINANGGKWNFFDESIKLAGNRQWWLSLNDSLWKEKLENYLKTDIGNSQLKKAWGTGRETDFETTFNTGIGATKNRRALHTLMGGDVAAYPERKTSETNPPNYETLTSSVYHRNTKEKEETPVAE